MESFGRNLCLAVDVEAYSKRLEPEQGNLQRDLTIIMAAAATAARLPIEGWNVQQQGDGQLALVPLDEHEPRYVDDLMGHLDTQLSRHNRSLVAEARIRLRVALHHGVAAVAENGFAGDAVVLTCRLRDSKIARDVLADCDANLVLLLSPSLYEDLVVNEHTRLRPADFTQVTIDEDKVDSGAWIWLPGGRQSESLQAARARKGSRRTSDGRPSVVNHIERIETDVANIGSVFYGEGRP